MARQFNEKKAAKQLDSYRHGKVGPTTRLLRDGLVDAGLINGTLLDVGTGVGALTFELLQRGITSAVAVDASGAYVAAAREEAARRHVQNPISFIHDDFLAAADRLSSFDVVAMDRVVCCYEDYTSLLREAVSRARSGLAISYPRAAWFVRFGHRVENGVRQLRSNPFRTFVHPVSEIQRMIVDSGFELKSRRETLAWSADVYARRCAPTDSKLSTSAVG